jgi:hypothetical protein
MTKLAALYVQALGEYGSGTGGAELSAAFRRGIRSLERWIVQHPLYVAGIVLALLVLWKLLFGKRAVGR